MAAGVLITVIVLNERLSDTACIAKMDQAHLPIAADMAAMDVSYRAPLGTSDVTSVPAAGQIQRVVRLTFGATYLAQYPTDAMQQAAITGWLRSIIEKRACCVANSEALALIP